MNETTHRFMAAGSVAADPKGLALLSAMIAAEIWATASPAQARGFYMAVGRRLAAAQPMDEATDLALLATRANMLWAALDWGHVDLHMEDQGIAIRHEGLPHALDGDVDGHWREIVSSVLEGVYDAWFRALGSGATLMTRTVDFNGGTLDLWHGH